MADATISAMRDTLLAVTPAQAERGYCYLIGYLTTAPDVEVTCREVIESLYKRLFGEE